MDILSALFGSNNAPPQAAAPAQPQQPPPAIPDRATFYAQLAAARAAAEKAHPSDFWSWVSGSGRDAAKASAAVDAPALYQALQTGQVGVQNAQLGSAQNFAQTGALTGTAIDPNNPMASVPAMQSAYSGALGGPQAQTPQGDQSAVVDPVQAQRALLMRMARFAAMGGKDQSASDYFKQANAGVPANTVVRPDGAVGDGINGKPINTDVGTLLARQGGQLATAQEAPKVAGQIKVAGVTAGLERGTHAANADVDAQHELVNGIDTKTGLPTTRTKASLLANGADGFAASNPYFDGQQTELKGLGEKSESADQGLGLATQIVNAANGIYTGKGSSELQNIRKTAQAVSQLTGVQMDPAINNDASKFEQLKFAAQQLVAVASHSLSPRVAMNIYNQISAVKPGDSTSIKGLRDIITNQIIPSLSRDKAIYGAASQYYKKNPMTNNALAVVPNQNPIENFSVKSVHAAKPGDYFIDPQTGNLRQRPMQ